MIELLSQQREEQDGYSLPFIKLDEMSADMMGKYHPALNAKPLSKTLIVDGVLYKDGKRLDYGEQIEPLNERPDCL
ncbi:hypothetical protein PAECIP112173_00334 [Paenibacillus sp. JJ-100]|uniref:hypothetical protein n=1 Tax=Paenibacillus sp. JJ-100 TaxID=2974896 RepID=UPI0022FF60A0|nr:hypothetical protein [Paenibacillus sp. JJ-100]CAI6023206.1 hypothetical protein PAECIP112173_00334 [Paenibacillus sp. JJ-100]